VERYGGEKLLRVQWGGSVRDLAVDAILVAVGRAPNVENMNLETAGVENDTREGIHADQRLRTTNRHSHAAGDCCPRYKLTPAADAMAPLVIRNALFLGRRRISSLLVPWCTYTDPEVAHVGLYEHEAQERGLAVQTFTQPLEHVDRAVL